MFAFFIPQFNYDNHKVNILYYKFKIIQFYFIYFD